MRFLLVVLLVLFAGGASAQHTRVEGGDGITVSGTPMNPIISTTADDLVIKEEGTALGDGVPATSIDFVGTGVTAVADASNKNELTVTFTGGSGSGGTNDTPSNSGSSNGETTVNDATNDFSIGGTGNVSGTEFFFDTSEGTLHLNHPGAKVIVEPHADNGSAMVLSEGTNDGSETYTLKVDDGGLADNYTCTIGSDGTWSGTGCPTSPTAPEEILVYEIAPTGTWNNAYPSTANSTITAHMHKGTGTTPKTMSGTGDDFFTLKSGSIYEIVYWTQAGVGNSGASAVSCRTTPYLNGNDDPYVTYPLTVNGTAGSTGLVRLMGRITLWITASSGDTWSPYGGSCSFDNDDGSAGTDGSIFIVVKRWT